HPGGALSVDGEDLVAGLDARPRRGRVVEGRDHHQRIAPPHHVQPQAAEFPGGVDLHLLEEFRGHEDGVRGEGRQHPADGALDELPLVDLLHVVVLHVRQHPGEELELLVGRVLRRSRRSGSSSQGGQEEERGETVHGCELGSVARPARRRRIPRWELDIHYEFVLSEYVMKPRLQLIPFVHRTTHRIGLYLEGAKPPLGLSQGEAHLLAHLAEAGACSVAELHRAFAHKRSTLTSYLDRLEARGGIPRHGRPQDRRSLPPWAPRVRAMPRDWALARPPRGVRRGFQAVLIALSETIEGPPPPQLRGKSSGPSSPSPPPRSPPPRRTRPSA